MGKFSVDVKKMLALFEEISAIFRFRFLPSLLQKYPNYLNNPVHAISVFIEGYAFEHQGRNPSYAHAAVEAIKKVEDPFASPQEIWEKFLKSLGNLSTNDKLNPLWHEEKSCKCVWCIFRETPNIIDILKNDMENGKLKKAHERLMAIRGVGPKISSLFLRDMAVLFELGDSLRDVGGREFLQPVDIWVRRTVKKMANDKNFKDENIAKWIVNNSEKPELVNQGIWYFGAQVAGSEFRLDKSIEDIDYANEISLKHVESMHSAYTAYMFKSQT